MKHFSIHGRFQPFHNGHLAYLREALTQANHIYIGITRPFGESNFEASENIRSGRHSQNQSANPFSYFQRHFLISQALQSASILPEQYSIIPFPLENPQLLHSFFPTTGTCLTTIKDRWNIDKIALLQSLNYAVEVLEIEKSDEYLSGTDIRELARLGDKSWLRSVPTGVARALAGWDGKPVEANYDFELRPSEETSK